MVKNLLTKAPILVPPIDREPLLLYIAANTQVVSATLVALQGFYPNPTTCIHNTTNLVTIGSSIATWTIIGCDT